MSDKAGQSGERTPDFIPGWFDARPGNLDPGRREAVRVFDGSFPIVFLRNDEFVGFRDDFDGGFRVSIGRHGFDYDLAVPPGCWIVRDAEGYLHNSHDEDFRAKYVRNNRQSWKSPRERVTADNSPTETERDEPAPHIVRQFYTTDDPEAWQGTPPAEGTRRALILDAILEHDGDSDEGQLELADAIEAALIRVGDQGAAPESGSPASVAMDLLDRFNIPRTRKGAILTIADRVTALADELVEYRREAVAAGNEFDRISIPRSTGATGATGTPRTLTLPERVKICVQRVLTEEEARRLLADTVSAQQRAMDTIRESTVKPGTRELHMILEPIDGKPGVSPDYRFIGIEDQDGRSIVFPWRVHPTKGDGYFHVVIPYGRDDAPGAPDNFGLSEQARAALAARIEEGRVDPDDLIEIARLG